MINIKRFREYCLELVTETNTGSSARINHLVLGVKEEHLMKKLRDAAGICLCVNYPDAQAEGVEDAPSDKQQVFFFVCEKTAPGTFNDEEELLHYETLQEVMLSLRDKIRNAANDCLNLIPEESFRIEWEYQIFGGFNGLSMGVTFKNYD